MPTLPFTSVNGDGTSPREWSQQDYTRIDDPTDNPSETTSGAIFPVVTYTDLANSTLTTSFTLDNMPTDFVSMSNDFSWTARLGWTGAEQGDDIISISMRIINGSTILAAGDSGGAFDVCKIGAGTTWQGPSGTSELLGPTAFTYVNTTATKADWDGAILEIRCIHDQVMGRENCQPVVYRVEFTGTYSSPPAALPLPHPIRSIRSLLVR